MSAAIVVLIFSNACVALLAVGLWLEHRATRTPSPVAGTGPSPVSSPTAGEGAHATDLAGRYWITLSHPPRRHRRLLAMLVENGQRSDLDPIEEARAYNRLVYGGLATGEIAAKIGRSAATVASRLALLRLPIAEQEQIRAGHYTLTHASKLIRDVRRAERARVNPTARPVGRPKGAKTRPYFGDQHPLAHAARTLCSCKAKPKVGGVACGECWERTIRDDVGVAA